MLPQWRAALSGGIVGETPFLSVAERDRRHFLILWCQTFGFVRGDAREALRATALSLHMLDWATAFAMHRRLRDKLLGVTALGCMAQNESIPLIAHLLDSRDALVSIAAAQAYARIAPKNALPFIIRSAATRADWSAARVMDILREAGPALVTEPLLAEIQRHDKVKLLRLIRYIGCADATQAAASLHGLLAPEQSAECIAAALPHVHSPLELDRIRQAAENPVWFVRVQACRALGRLGTKEDVPLLSCLAGDKHWWVRYRAAEALTRLPFVRRAALQQLHDGHSDRYAREMLGMWIDATKAAP